MNQLEARLVRIDVPDCAAVTCTVFSHTNKVGTLSSLEYNNPENSLLIPIKGNLRIVVSSGFEQIGSVSIPFSLLSESGCLWLPILPPDDSDYIDALPEELCSPKILVYFERKNPEDLEERPNELEVTKGKLKTLTQHYQELIQNSKSRELSLLKALEEKETEIQDYIQQLSKAQSKIFSLIAEKKHISDSLSRAQLEISYNNVNEIAEELEITRTELSKSETRNECLLRKLEDISSEWNFIEEETKHFKESELLTQISQLRQELELKNKEISVLKSFQAPSILGEISNKPPQEKPQIELSDTIRYSKPSKLKSSASNDMLPNNSYVCESIQASMISEEDNLMNCSLFSQPCSRGISPSLKENQRKLEGDKSKGSFRGPTISSQNKTKYIPVPTYRRMNQSTERRQPK